MTTSGVRQHTDLLIKQFCWFELRKYDNRLMEIFKNESYFLTSSKVLTSDMSFS